MFEVYLQTLFGYFGINLASLVSCFEIITGPNMRKGASSYLSKSNWKMNYSFTTVYLSALMLVAPQCVYSLCSYVFFLHLLSVCNYLTHQLCSKVLICISMFHMLLKPASMPARTLLKKLIYCGKNKFVSPLKISVFLIRAE